MTTTTSGVLRLGLVGCGRHASQTIHPALVRVEEVDVVAACDLLPERAERAARRFGARPYTDLQRMLADEALDAALVIGPPAIHHDLGLQVLRTGKHLIVEKPPANSADGALDLVEAARAAGRMGAVSTHWRHAPTHRRMKDLMATPEFGPPVAFVGHFHAPGPMRPGLHDSTFRAYLWDQAIHLVDCTRYLMGEITEVSAAGHEGANGAVALSLHLRFASGCLGQLGLISGTPMVEQYVAAYGEGRCRVQSWDMDRLEFQRMPPWTGAGGYGDLPVQTWRPATSPTTGAESSAYVQEHRHFAQALLRGEQPRASLEDGYRALRVLDAADESRKAGRPVSINYRY
jgi:predicted dehydrogenase